MIGRGATFDTEAVQGMADIIRGQMLVLGLRRACSPVIDVAKEPRWSMWGQVPMYAAQRWGSLMSLEQQPGFNSFANGM